MQDPCRKEGRASPIVLMIVFNHGVMEDTEGHRDDLRVT
jgi:hypothetical protein